MNKAILEEVKVKLDSILEHVYSCQGLRGHHTATAPIVSKVHDIKNILSSVAPVDDWIDCNDRLPENLQVVDIWSTHNPNNIGRYVNLKYEDFNNEKTFASSILGMMIPIRNVTHWKSSPQPPTDKES